MNRGEFEQLLRYLERGGSVEPVQAHVHMCLFRANHQRLRIMLAALLESARLEALMLQCHYMSPRALSDCWLARHECYRRGTLLHRLLRRSVRHAATVIRHLGAQHAPVTEACRTLGDAVVAANARLLLQDLYALSPLICDGRDARGRTLMHRAVAAKDTRTVTALFTLFPAYCVCRDARDRSPLEDAVRTGAVEIARVFLQYRQGMFFSTRLFAVRPISRAMQQLLLETMPQPLRLTPVERAAAAAITPHSARGRAILSARGTPRESKHVPPLALHVLPATPPFDVVQPRPSAPPEAEIDASHVSSTDSSSGEEDAPMPVTVTRSRSQTFSGAQLRRPASTVSLGRGRAVSMTGTDPGAPMPSPRRLRRLISMPRLTPKLSPRGRRPRQRKKPL